MNQTTNPPPSNSVNDDNSLLECDLIMKGGITSGIVYPKAIHHLSQHYRFRSIGGASAGAIAAALSAAAQYGRAANPAVFDQPSRSGMAWKVFSSKPLMLNSAGSFVFSGTPAELAKRPEVLDLHLGVSGEKNPYQTGTH